jgi:hypothetical protein
MGSNRHRFKLSSKQRLSLINFEITGKFIAAIFQSHAKRTKVHKTGDTCFNLTYVAGIYLPAISLVATNRIGKKDVVYCSPLNKKTDPLDQNHM